MKKRKGWLSYRVEHLPQGDLTTNQVRDFLKVSERLLRQWISDPYFKDAEVAKQKDGHWIWNGKRLELWATAMLRMKRKKIQSNPPPVTREEARQELGIPLDYAPRANESGSERSADTATA